MIHLLHYLLEKQVLCPHQETIYMLKLNSLQKPRVTWGALAYGGSFVFRPCRTHQRRLHLRKRRQEMSGGRRPDQLEGSGRRLTSQRLA